MPLPYVPDRVLWIRFLAALAPGVLLFLLWLSGRGSSGLPSGTIVQLTHSRSFEGQPSLSPDGMRIAFRCDDRGNSDICVTDAAGGKTANLTADSLDEESEPAFSPDGQVIAFRSGSRGIFTMPAGGGAFTQITTSGSQPAWTPDGRSLVYSVTTIPGAVFRQGVTEGFVVDVATRASRRIPLVIDLHQPAVSPRGDRVAYVGRPMPATTRRGVGNSRTDLWTVSIDGRQPVRVTNDASIEASPIWSPIGQFLYYVSDRNGSSAMWRVAIDDRTGYPLGRPEVVPTPYSQPVHLTRSADGRRIVWADVQPIERRLRVAFDAEARTIRGAPVEIPPGVPDYDESDAAADDRPPQAPATGNPSMPLAALAYPGHWSPQRSLYAGTAGGAVWIYSPATRDHYQLRPGKSPVWLNDGRRLIFAWEGRLMIAEAVLKISRELIALPDQTLGAPRLSTDNQRLYFTAEGADSNLWMMRVGR